MATRAEIEETLQDRRLPVLLCGVRIATFTRDQLKHVYWILTGDSNPPEELDDVELCTQIVRLAQTQGVEDQQHKEIRLYARSQLQPGNRRPDGVIGNASDGSAGQPRPGTSRAPGFNALPSIPEEPAKSSTPSTASRSSSNRRPEVGANGGQPAQNIAPLTADNLRTHSSARSLPDINIEPPVVTGRTNGRSASRSGSRNAPGPSPPGSIPPSAASARSHIPNTSRLSVPSSDRRSPSTGSVPNRPASRVPSMPPLQIEPTIRGGAPSILSARDNAPTVISSSSANPGERQYECPICIETLPRSQFPTSLSSSTCRHTSRHMCTDCLQQYIESSAASTAFDEIRCPAEGCQGYLNYAFMRSYATAATFARYDTFINTKALGNDATFLECANPICNHGVDINEVHGDFVTCGACPTSTCITCRTTWHPDISHEQNLANTRRQAEADEAADDAMLNAAARAAPSHAGNTTPTPPNPPRAQGSAASTASTTPTLKETTKRCPECGIRIQKTGGCSKMTCTSCRYEFCWHCLADHELIMMEGNQMHRPECVLYAIARVERGLESSDEDSDDSAMGPWRGEGGGRGGRGRGEGRRGVVIWP